MSRGARWTLGIAALLGAWAVLLPGSADGNRLLIFGVAAFFGLIAIACFSKIARPIAVRILGGSVFLAYAYYLLYEIAQTDSTPWSFFNEPHWINALIGLLLFGLPGLYVATSGKFPWWGIGAKAFGSSELPQNHQSPEDDDSENHRA